MKECDDYNKLFSDYLEKTLDEKNRQSLQKHLASCAACKAKIDDLRNIKHILSDLPRIKTSRYFDQVLYSRIRQEKRAKQTQRWIFPFFELNWKTTVYAVAAVALVFLGAFWQRLSYTSMNNQLRINQIAVEQVLQGEMNYIDPGYMIFVRVDSAKSTYRIINYTTLDYAETMKAFQNTRATSTVYSDESELPNLKEAPQNEGVLVLKEKQSERQQIKNAEYNF